VSKKKSGATKKRKVAATKRRTEHAVNLKPRIQIKPAVEKQRGYWHGGWPGLEPGTVLVGSAEAPQHGINPTRYMPRYTGAEPNPTDPKRVYFSSSRDFAKAFAARMHTRDITTGVAFQHGALYRVEPLGDVEMDPDFEIGGVSWCAPQARIVAVEDPNVMADVYTATKALGPYMTWSDQSPVYTDQGKYIPSPEQIRAGQSQSLLVSLLPWTPVDHINAALTGTSTGERPNAAKHPGITLEADEATTVWLRHFSRATELTQQGITFSDNYTKMRDDVNELIAPTELGTEDARGVIVALHPADGVIGACIITAAQMEDQMVMFIDKVAVAPAWRRQGIGSVMLLTSQQLLPSTVDFAAGHCAPELGPFFAQMGYTVLKPGVPLLLAVNKREEDIGSLQIEGDCWFHRQGRM
jgi:GNAT superfamily N-acetyltransferase